MFPVRNCLNYHQNTANNLLKLRPHLATCSVFHLLLETVFLSRDKRENLLSHQPTEAQPHKMKIKDKLIQTGQYQSKRLLTQSQGHIKTVASQRWYSNL